jgi:hypothetical protein
MHHLEHIIEANSKIVSPAIDSAKATGKWLAVVKTGLNVTGTAQHDGYREAADWSETFVNDKGGASVDIYGPDGTLTAVIK